MIAVIASRFKYSIRLGCDGGGGGVVGGGGGESLIFSVSLKKIFIFLFDKVSNKFQFLFLFEIDFSRFQLLNESTKEQ